MLKQIILWIVAISIASSSCASRGMKGEAQANQPIVQEWDYRVVEPPNPDYNELYTNTEPTLKRFGKEGWELVDVQFNSLSEGRNRPSGYIFKKRIK